MCCDHSHTGTCFVGYLHAVLSSADFFQNKLFLKNSFRDAIRVSNSLDPDQAQRFVGSDLDPNCLQRFSADYTGRYR